MNPLKFLAKSSRAIYAGLIAFGTGLSAVLVGDISISDVSDGQWLVISLGALTAFGGVWGFVNPTFK